MCDGVEKLWTAFKGCLPAVEEAGELENGFLEPSVKCPPCPAMKHKYIKQLTDL